MVAGPARPIFLQKGQGAFVADQAERPDGAVSLSEGVVLRTYVCHQRLDPVAGVLLHRQGAELPDA